MTIKSTTDVTISVAIFMNRVCEMLAVVVREIKFLYCGSFFIPNLQDSSRQIE